MTGLKTLWMGTTKLSGSLPSQFCGISTLTALNIWYNGGPNAAITCTRSCLSTKMGSYSAPASLPECPATTISLSTQRGLCAFIAATNVASVSGYSSWACDVYGQVTTQPCNGGTAVWPGITGCSSNGDVTALSINSKSIAGSLPSAFGLMTTLTSFQLESNSLTGSRLEQIVDQLFFFCGDCAKDNVRL